MPTLKEARKLFKESGTLKYRGSKQIVLRELIEATFKGQKFADADITGKKFTVKASKLCKAAGCIKDQQLMNVIESLEEVSFEGREDGAITYRLDLKPLDTDEQKQEQERRNRERTEKARLKKAAQRAKKNAPYAQTFHTPITLEVLKRCAPFQTSRIESFCVN